MTLKPHNRLMIMCDYVYIFISECMNVIILLPCTSLRTRASERCFRNIMTINLTLTLFWFGRANPCTPFPISQFQKSNLKVAQWIASPLVVTKNCYVWRPNCLANKFYNLGNVFPTGSQMFWQPEKLRMQSNDFTQPQKMVTRHELSLIKWWTNIASAKWCSQVPKLLQLLPTDF